MKSQIEYEYYFSAISLSPFIQLFFLSSRHLIAFRHPAHFDCKLNVPPFELSFLNNYLSISLIFMFEIL
jgi:hypothetical protein